MEDEATSARLARIGNANVTIHELELCCTAGTNGTQILTISIYTLLHVWVKSSHVYSVEI